MAKLRDDLVRKNEILKSQLVLEEKARLSYMKKWGFLLDFDKIYVEEARKKGILLGRSRDDDDNDKKCNYVVGEFARSETVPITASAMVGWRCRHKLEVMGKLYVSPLHTLPAEAPASHIKLG